MEGQRGYVPPSERISTNTSYQQTGSKRADETGSTASRQTGVQPASDFDSTGFQQEGFQQGGFRQGGFHDEGPQPTDPANRPDMWQGGFNAPSEGKSSEFQNKGYEPPPGQRTTLSSEEFREIEIAVKAAQDALDKASSLIARVAFTPQRSTAFD